MRMNSAIILLGASMTLPLFAQSTADAKRLPEVLVSNPNYSRPVGLAIHGFNYTDRVISMFSIDHRGGGNIFVNSSTSSGGKTTCCMRWYPGSQLSRPVKIEWMRYIDGRRTWCKKEVMLNAPFPQNPTDVSVHFMPDGDIEVDLTEGYPEPKLRLEDFDDGHRKKEGNLIYDEQTANCQSKIE